MLASHPQNAEAHYQIGRAGSVRPPGVGRRAHRAGVASGAPPYITSFVDALVAAVSAQGHQVVLKRPAARRQSGQPPRESAQCRPRAVARNPSIRDRPSISFPDGGANEGAWARVALGFCCLAQRLLFGFTQPDGQTLPSGGIPFRALIQSVLHTLRERQSHGSSLDRFCALAVRRTTVEHGMASCPTPESAEPKEAKPGKHHAKFDTSFMFHYRLLAGLLSQTASIHLKLSPTVARSLNCREPSRTVAVCRDPS